MVARWRLREVAGPVTTEEPAGTLLKGQRCASKLLRFALTIFYSERILMQAAKNGTWT
jgi:hypothetical protein